MNFDALLRNFTFYKQYYYSNLFSSPILLHRMPQCKYRLLYLWVNLKISFASLNEKLNRSQLVWWSNKNKL